tara:strand:- start:63 stop:680 length:618 start_codon:yes stop_codon:yes gene_type:complete
MKNLSIITIILSIITFSSCEEDVDFVVGCMDSEALNYNSSATEDDDSCEFASLSVSELILGDWNLDSSSLNMIFPEDIVELLMMMSLMITPEEFEDEVGFPMPSSSAEWDDFAVNGISQDLDISGVLTITSSIFSINDDQDGITELEYQLVNENTIEFLNPGEEVNFDHFIIDELNETNLVLTTSFQVEEEEMIIDVLQKMYFSK